MSFAAALIRIDVRGLPALTGETYQAWLVKSATNQAVPVGAFPGDPGGIAGYTGKLTNLEGYDYDLLMITVEPVADTDPGPSARRVVGGFFQPACNNALP